MPPRNESYQKTQEGSCSACSIRTAPTTSCNVSSARLPRKDTCAFLLPKFHCELNFIDFFCGAVKRWLQENYHGTFRTLPEKSPQSARIGGNHNNPTIQQRSGSGSIRSFGDGCIPGMSDLSRMLDFKSKPSAQASLTDVFL